MRSPAPRLRPQPPNQYWPITSSWLINLDKLAGMVRLWTYLLAVCLFLLVGVSSASASVVSRLAGIETPTSSPFDFDQVGTNCSGSVAARDTARAYAGSASLRVEIDTTSCSPYARGIFNSNSPNHVVSGDDFWFGGAIYLPAGFYSAHTNYTDLLRVDSYVEDNGTSNPESERQSINFASFSNDDLYVQAEAPGGSTNTLVGPLSPSILPEGQWSWIEIHADLSTSSGTAYTELKVDGVSQGSSTKANIFSGRDDFNRFRYGFVSAGSSGSGDLTAYIDRASVHTSERGPLTATTPGLVSFWRLNETSGTTANDASDLADGTYVNGPTLNVTGLQTSDNDPAASFDGTNDHVSVTPISALNMTGGVTLEAWIKPDALQGSIVRRNNSYELRANSDGSVLFRVWISGNVQSLTSSASKVVTGEAQHVVGTYDGATMRSYVNGVQIASRAQSGAMTHDSNSLYFGFNDFSSTYFDGVLDDIAIYDEVLDATTVAQHYDSGS